MKKFFTFIVAALMAASASADEITATLIHTSSSYTGDATTFTSDVDAAQEYINNQAMSAAKWQGVAYAEFSIELPEGHSVVSASLGATDKPCGVRTVANPKLLLNDT